MAAAKSNDRKVTSPKFRASFAWIFKPQPPMEGSTGEPKYGVTMLFDAAARKTAQFEAMKKLAHAAAKEKFGDKLKSDGNGWYHGLRNPFRDGAEKSELEGYAGMVFVAATTKMQPGCVDNALNRLITDEVSPEGFYSGCFARATLTAYGYDKAGNKGVAFGLQNVQKLGDGEAFSGRTAAENDFDSVDDFVGEGEQASGSFLD
ncbi:putative DNA binding protein [Stenotrophomonas phage DLP4]|nr:putative DNA binding protein [Stenotrophomonas phage DLP4]